MQNNNTIRTICRSNNKNDSMNAQYYPCRRELLAISALRQLQENPQQEQVDEHKLSILSNTSSTSLSTNRIVVHCLTVLSIFTIWGMIGFLFQHYLLPYILVAITNTQIILNGTGEGTTCSVWNYSPYQQAKCALISHCSYMIMHFTSTLYSDMQKMQSFPTLVAYIFSTTCGAYFFFNRFLKTFLYGLFNLNLKLYSSIYQTFTNPHLPFDYIEEAIHSTN